VIGGVLDTAEERDRRGAPTVHRLRDAFALQRIHQTGGVADQEHSTIGRLRPDESHLEPCAEGTRLRPRRTTGVENSNATRVGNEGVEVARGASARTPVGQHADSETDVRTALARRKRPSVPGEG
jgi:hypothetical protein